MASKGVYITGYLWIALSFAIVFVSVFTSGSVPNLNVKTTVEFDDIHFVEASNSYSSVCWINPDGGSAQDTLRHFPTGCSFLDPSVVINTYVGHQFLVVRPDKTIDQPAKIVTVRSTMNYVDINEVVTYNAIDSFDFLVEWQRIMLLRRHIALTLACILLLSILIHSGYSKQNKEKEREKDAGIRVSSAKTCVSRHYLKAYAVLTMVLDHVGHTFMRNLPILKPLVTLLADAGGSSQIFNWLVGYNLTASQRSSEVILLSVFIVLQVFVSLPPPMTFETLLNISVERLLLRCSIMTVDPRTRRCRFADMHILQHAAVISAMALLDIFTGVEGLKVLNITGIFFCISGRLFALNSTSSCNWKMLLWMSAAVHNTMYTMRYNCNITYSDSVQMQLCYAAVFAIITVVHAAVLSWKSKSNSAQPIERSPSKQSVLQSVAQWIAKYSLEIYIVHLISFKIVYDFMFVE